VPRSVKVGVGPGGGKETRCATLTATRVLATGAVRYAGSDDPGQRAVEGHEPATASGVLLLDQPMQAGPYSFDTTPDGWEVQGASAFAVTIAPVGAPDQDPNSFLGKLVILFDQNPPSGEQEAREGRTFWIRGDSGHTTISTRTRPGEPTGVVSIQFPDDAGWSRDSMLEFLAGVHVGEGAQPGLG
jgi:hypothetical protein